MLSADGNEPNASFVIRDNGEKGETVIKSFKSDLITRFRAIRPKIMLRQASHNAT